MSFSATILSNSCSKICISGAILSAGRFTDIALQYGARVIAFDLSSAVDACYENCSVYRNQLGLMQASIYDLPLKSSIADGLYCMGVIQHTPDPQKTMRILPKYLKQNAKLVYNFYEKDFWPKLQPIKYALRLFTPYLSHSSLMRLVNFLMMLCYPITTVLSRIPKVRILSHGIPIAASHHLGLTDEQQRIWTMLDTYDWYSPRYEIRQSNKKVSQLLEQIGLTCEKVQPGIVRAAS